MVIDDTKNGIQDEPGQSSSVESINPSGTTSSHACHPQTKSTRLDPEAEADQSRKQPGKLSKRGSSVEKYWEEHHKHIHSKRISPKVQNTYSKTYFLFRNRNRENSKMIMNAPSFRLTDWFHTVLSLKWYYQALFILVVYVSTAGVFALLYLAAGPDGIRGFEDGGDYLWLSIQTLTTVGYGRLEPFTVYAQCVGAINALVGILLLSLTSGLVFTVVSKPNSRCVFADRCVIEPVCKSTNGFRRLHVRFVNVRRSFLYDVTLFAQLNYFVKDQVNGGILMRSIPLKFLQDGHAPRILYGRSFYHVIDHSSPLYSKQMAWLQDHAASLLVCLICLDSDFNSTTATSKVYDQEHIGFDELFVNLRVHSPGDTQNFVYDCNNLHRTFSPSAEIRKIFEELDVDKDGEISHEEMEQYIKKYGCFTVDSVQYSASHLLAHFHDVDKNKNGYLSWDEFQRGLLLLRQEANELE